MLPNADHKVLGLNSPYDCMGFIAQRARPGGRGFDPRRGWQHSFIEIDHEIFSMVILPLPLIEERLVSGNRMCTILVNGLEDSLPIKCVVR